MSLDALTQPLERQQYLPGMFNYTGTWVTGTYYYANDVVLSPADGQLYIAATPFTSNVDPALVPPPSAWISFAGSVTTGNPMEWLGAWSAVTTYKDGDVVTDSVNYQPYVCIVASSLNQVPSATPASWAIVGTVPTSGVGVNAVNTAGVTTLSLSTQTSAILSAGPVAAGPNAMIFQAPLAGNVLVLNGVYLFSVRVTFGSTVGTAGPELVQSRTSATVSASSAELITTLPQIAAGQFESVTLTGTIAPIAPGAATQPLVGTTVLPAGTAIDSITYGPCVLLRLA